MRYNSDTKVKWDYLWSSQDFVSIFTQNSRNFFSDLKCKVIDFELIIFIALFLHEVETLKIVTEGYFAVKTFFQMDQVYIAYII